MIATFGPPCETCGHFETLDGWCLNYKCEKTGWQDGTRSGTSVAPESGDPKNTGSRPEEDP